MKSAWPKFWKPILLWLSDIHFGSFWLASGTTESIFDIYDITCQFIFILVFPWYPPCFDISLHDGNTFCTNSASFVPPNGVDIAMTLFIRIVVAILTASIHISPPSECHMILISSSRTYRSIFLSLSSTSFDDVEISLVLNFGRRGEYTTLKYSLSCSHSIFMQAGTHENQGIKKTVWLSLWSKESDGWIMTPFIFRKKCSRTILVIDSHGCVYSIVCRNLLICLYIYIYHLNI